MNVYKPTFIINNSFQGESKDGTGESKKYLRGNAQANSAALKNQLHHSSQQVLKKPNTLFEPKVEGKVTKTRTTAAGDKTKSSKLVSQHQAQFLTQNAQVLTASGGNSAS